MLIRRHMLAVHGADPARWAKRYDIKPCTAECYDCNRPRTTTIPFAYGRLRGLMSPTCECGNDRGPYCVVMQDLGDLATARDKKRR